MHNMTLCGSWQDLIRTGTGNVHNNYVECGNTVSTDDMFKISS